MRMATDAVQIHGRIGYTKWHALENFRRDAKGIQIFEGSELIMRRPINLFQLSTDAIPRVFQEVRND